MATPEARSWLLPGARGNFLSVGTFCNPHPMCVQVTLYQRAMQFSIGKMQLGFPKHYNPHTMPVKVALYRFNANVLMKGKAPKMCSQLHPLVLGHLTCAVQ